MSSHIYTISDTKRKLRNTRIALLVLGAFLVVDFFASLAIYSERQELKQENQELKQENKHLLEDLDTYKSSSVYWKEKSEHYQTANKALIKYAEPTSLNRAIQATPLPKLIEV